MKDYYKILGVEEEASEEEIRARWVELTKRYHPDLGKTAGEDERIKEINEAYGVLKDYSKRLDYDLPRLLKKSFIEKAESRKEKRRIVIQRIILSSGIFVLFLIVGFLVTRGFHVAKPPKSEALYEIGKVLEKKSALQIPLAKTEPKVIGEKKVPKEIKEVIPQESPKIASIPSPPPSSVREEPKRKEEPARKILSESEVPVKVGEEIPKEIRKEIPQEKTKIASAPLSPSLRPAEKESKPVKELVPQRVIKSEMPGKVDQEVSKQATEVTLPPGEKLQSKIKEEKEVPKETDKVISQASPKMDQPKPIVTEPYPVQKPETSVKAERAVILPPPLLANEEEVKQFFSNYVNRYIRKDINGFLSFFSSKAIQNQKDDLEKIRSIYTKFFNQSEELRYALEGLKIEIYRNSVEVKTRFRVDQKLKKRGEEKIWKGNIRWVLVREEGALRISLLDYQNEKSP